MPLSGAPVPDLSVVKTEPRRRRMSEYFRPGKRMPLPKGKALAEGYVRLQQEARIAWAEVADMATAREAEKRRLYDRIDRLTNAQEFMRKEFTDLRDEVKKLTLMLKK